MTEHYHSIARMTSVVAAMAGRIERLRRARAVKSINEVLREYKDTLDRWVIDATNGNMTAGAIASKWRPLLLEDARAVYIEGMREGGVKDPGTEMDEVDDAAIGDWVLTQTPHIYPFADDAVAAGKLKGDERMAARDAMLGRVEVWVQSLEALGRIGTANAKANQMGEWRYGDTEHCETCAWLNGQRHRLKWFISKGYIPREPGSQTLDCNGFNCQCGIYGDDGERLL